VPHPIHPQLATSLGQDRLTSAATEQLLSSFQVHNPASLDLSLSDKSNLKHKASRDHREEQVAVEKYLLCDCSGHQHHLHLQPFLRSLFHGLGASAYCDRFAVYDLPVPGLFDYGLCGSDNPIQGQSL